MDLTREQRKELHTALLDAFPTEASLAQMIRLELGKHLDELATGENLAIVAFRLIEWAESSGQIADLVRAAVTDAPNHRTLRAIAIGMNLPLPATLLSGPTQLT